MWDELKYRIRNKSESLAPYGWDDDEDFEETHNRHKFVTLIQRYQSYVSPTSAAERSLIVHAAICAHEYRSGAR